MEREILHETGRRFWKQFNQDVMRACFARFCELRKKPRSNIHKLIDSSSWPEREETIRNYYDSRNENEVYIKQVS